MKCNKGFGSLNNNILFFLPNRSPYQKNPIFSSPILLNELKIKSNKRSEKKLESFKQRNNLILKPRLSLKEEIIKSPFSPEFSCLSKIHLRFGKSATLLTNDLPNDMTPKDNGDEYLPGRNPGNEPNGIFEKGLEQLQHVLAHKRFPVLFLRSLRNSTQNLKTFKDMDLLRGESGKALAEEIRDLSFKLIEKNKNLATDRPAQAHLLMSCFILSSYRILTSKNMSHEHTMELLHYCLSSNIKEWMNLLIKIPLLTSNPMPILSSAFATVIRLRGKTFTGELLDDSTFNSFLFVNVKKCFFNDFFTKNGASYLTGLFCAAEAKILEGIDPMKFNVRLDIPTRLADGKKRCSFQFRKMQIISDRLPKPIF